MVFMDAVVSTAAAAVAPAESSSFPASELTILVTTCAPYMNVTLPHLLRSLEEAGIPEESVVMVAGQVRDPTEHELFVRAKGHTCPWTFEAGTGLMYAAEHPEIVKTPWILHIQCTMLAEPDFADKVSRVFRETVRDSEEDVWKLLDTFSLTVGFVRTSWLLRQCFDKLKVVPKDTRDIQRLKMWCEDKVFENARCGALGRFADPESRKVLGTMSYPGGGAERIIESYPLLGLVKFKSWYGQCVDSIDGVPSIPIGP